MHLTAEQKIAKDLALAEAAARRRDEKEAREAGPRPVHVPPPPCPDPLDPDALKALYSAAYRTVWGILHDARATNQDRLAAFASIGRMSGMGKEPPPADEHRIPMDSLLPKAKGKGGGEQAG